MQAMSDFAIQLNKNSFGLTVTEQMHVATPIMPGQSITVSKSKESVETFLLGKRYLHH